MTKLIKLSEQHYIIVDDSEIKALDWCLDTITNLYFQYYSKRVLKDTDKKITHSTQPLELVDWEDGSPGKRPAFDKIKLLLLSEIEEVINGYNLKEKSEQSFENMGYHSTVTPHEENQFKLGYKLGFKEHQELVKDKLFTLEDILSFLDLHTDDAPISYLKSEFIKYSQPKTEWDIEIDSNNKITLI